MNNNYLMIHDICNYISLANEELKKIIYSNKYFKKCDDIIPYSFTLAKLQKIFIISILKYFNNVSTENPIVDLNNVNIVNYGFSIE